MRPLDWQERVLLEIVRRALLMIVRAIEDALGLDHKRRDLDDGAP